MLGVEPIISSSEVETVNYGRSWSPLLTPGSVLCFFGELGSGKTTLIKGIVDGLGGDGAEKVCSPTFSYLNIYNGRHPIYHFDLYRLKTCADFLCLGFEEYLDSSGICCIEWSERIEEILPDHCWRIEIGYGDKMDRIITVKQTSSKTR